jgi:hypothetical protein
METWVWHQERTRMKSKDLTSRDKTKRERGEKRAGDSKGKEKEKSKY